MKMRINLAKILITATLFSLSVVGCSTAVRPRADYIAKPDSMRCGVDLYGDCKLVRNPNGSCYIDYSGKEKAD